MFSNLSCFLSLKTKQQDLLEYFLSLKYYKEVESFLLTKDKFLFYIIIQSLSSTVQCIRAIERKKTNTRYLELHLEIYILLA